MDMKNVAVENRNLNAILHNAYTVVTDHYFGGIVFSRPTVVLEVQVRDITVKINGFRELHLNGQYLLGLTYIEGEYILEIYTGYDKVDDPYDGGQYIGRVTEVL